MTDAGVLPPGRAIGILGGGQLGRMLATAAAQLGYPVHIFAPDDQPPAAPVANRHAVGDYHDAAAVRDFAGGVDVLTYEWENIPAGPLRELGIPVHPSPDALDIAQDRAREKAFVAALGGRPAPFAPVDGPDDLRDALARLGAPAILKTRRWGYDGKGQVRLRPGDDPDAAWVAIGEQPAVLEAFVPFEAEFSILLARGRDGAIATWEAPENRHEGGILRTSRLPAPAIVRHQEGRAAALAARVADALGYVGVLALEFFATSEGPIFNEMAPRVHNSGHWTIEGAQTSQFENHVRAVCGLPLGSTATRGREVVMTNLIGDEANDWATVLAEPGAHLHLYGKDEPRPGRKMGHVTRVRD